MCNASSICGILPILKWVQPDEGEGYLVVARDLFKGVEALSTAIHIPPRACALIASHALECTLKAYLLHKGKRSELKKREIRHNIQALWNLVYREQTLGIPEQPPDWVQILGDGHGPNFYFRYQEGENKTIVNGGQTPALVPMTDGLRKLLEQVELSTNVGE